MINLKFSEVLETEDFLNLDMTRAMEWVSSDNVTVFEEDEIFRGIVKWVSSKRVKEKAVFLIYCVKSAWCPYHKTFY